MTATPTNADPTSGTTAELIVDVAAGTGLSVDVLRAVSQRVLWLSAAIVDAANRGRVNTSGV